MLTKLTLLVAVAQAAIGFTLGGTAALPTNYVAAKTASTGGSSKDYAKNGYACVRRGWIYGYPAVYSSGNVVPGTQSSTILAFYPTAESQLGTANTAADDGVAGQNSGCYADLTTTNNKVLVSADNTPVSNRLFWKSGADYTADTGTAGAQLMINVDFVLATMYQNSWATGDRVAANYCDKQVHALTSSTKTSNMVTMNGLNGLTKCTYFITVAAAAGAPAFKITNLDYAAFQLHYAEWNSVDMTNKFLVTNPYVGTIATADTFPSPVRTSITSGPPQNNWPVTAAHHANWQPATLTAGSVGTFQAYALFEGTPFTGTTAASVNYDSGALLRELDMTQAAYTSYNTAKSTYDTSRTTYNTALTNEKTRAGDFFKSIFEAPVKIPQRPCPPTQPRAWSGPQIDWWASNTFNSINATSKPKNYGVFLNLAETLPTLQAGWLAATPDDSATPLVAAPGHTFGLRGQGTATNAVDGSAFAGIVLAATTHGMMVSLFPYTMTDTTGIASGKNVTIQASAVAWRANYFSAPVQPAAAVAPDAASAIYLAAGVASVAAIVSTLI